MQSSSTHPSHRTANASHCIAPHQLIHHQAASLAILGGISAPIREPRLSLFFDLSLAFAHFGAPRRLGLAFLAYTSSAVFLITGGRRCVLTPRFSYATVPASDLGTMLSPHFQPQATKGKTTAKTRAKQRERTRSSTGPQEVPKPPPSPAIT